MAAEAVATADPDGGRGRRKAFAVGAVRVEAAGGYSVLNSWSGVLFKSIPLPTHERTTRSRSKYCVKSTAASSLSSSLSPYPRARHRAVQRHRAAHFSQCRFSPCGCLLAPSRPSLPPPSLAASGQHYQFTSGHHHRAHLRGHGRRRDPCHASPSRPCAKCSGASRSRCPYP